MPRGMLPALPGKVAAGSQFDKPVLSVEVIRE
jgi:hypothetical protein